MTISRLDALLDRVGAGLGTTTWQRISQEDVQRFAEATRAREWIHVDVDRARRESPFGTTVAHGYLTLSLATVFVTELVGAGDDLVGINYGLERVRFPAAVPVGSRVRARGTLLAALRQNGGIRTTIELVYELEGGDRPPCIAEVVSLLIPATPPSR